MTTSDTELPQFTPKYWAKATRKMSPQVPIVNMNTKDGWKHIQLANGATLRHPQSMVQQLLTVGTVVQAQYIRTAAGEVITGCYLPQVNGWAWELTDQDLADQVKALSIAVEKQKARAHEKMVLHVAEPLQEALENAGVSIEDNPDLPFILAETAINALESGAK